LVNAIRPACPDSDSRHTHQGRYASSKMTAPMYVKQSHWSCISPNPYASGQSPPGIPVRGSRVNSSHDAAHASSPNVIHPAIIRT